MWHCWLSRLAEGTLRELKLTGTQTKRDTHQLSCARFVWDDYTWNPDGSKYSMYNGKLIPSTIPISTMLSGKVSVMESRSDLAEIE